MNYLGIDIGSKTVKVMLVNAETDEVLYSDYFFHRSQVQKHLLGAIHDMVWHLGSDETRITVTGSAGMRVAELFNIPFVQEVVALKRAVTRYVPQADAILEMGGEDTKLVYLTGTPEQRMNNVCAGGTGSFIEMMAGLMGKGAEDLGKLALGYSTIYPIASRCAVFAKSDVRPLLNAGAKKEDVAMSVLEAVCTQAVAGLSAGRPLEGTVVLLGGPFEYISALREAFCHVTGFDREHAIVPEDAHMFVVRGAVLSAEKSAPMQLADFEQAIRDAAFESNEGPARLPALFASEEEYEQFARRHARCRLPRVELPMAGENLFLGIDAGSTTMKMALINEDGALCAYEYGWNEGDVTVSLTEMLSSIYGQMYGAMHPDYAIRRSCIVGYGEDFCRAAYKIDMSEVETVAHLRAAVALEPDLDFLMDIGGQDIKCFYVEDGMITDVVLNEACSSGCGSLFDSVARSMRKKKEAFAKEALFAKAPVDLGTRCATFMDSRIKHAQKEGVPTDDIAAGVCYSTARNALYKVVRQPDFTKVGKKVVVQGGAFANDALLRAFELETGVEVLRPDLSQLMGAWGAALLARDEWLAARDANPEAATGSVSTLVGRNELQTLTINREATRCEQCPNHCRMMVTHFTDAAGGPDRVYVTGNRCEKGLAAQDAGFKAVRKPPNMFKVKNALISACDNVEQPDSAHVVGIPKALALYESYPFWKRFFNELGVAVVGSPASSDRIFREGMSAIPAEGACYPSKLLYGHAAEVVNLGADIVFVPNMSTAFAREGLLGLEIDVRSVACPLVETAGTMVAGNAPASVMGSASIAVPDLRGLTKLEQAARPIAEALQLADLSFSEQQVLDALRAASASYRQFFETLAKRNAQVLEQVDAGAYQGALVAGHAYHIDEGISHRIDDLLGALGYAVLEQVDYSFLDGATADAQGEGPRFDWTENARMLDQIQAASDHALQVIVLRSFGCGVDALVADEIHDRLRASDRVYAELKLDQIVDLAAVRIRLRSLAYAANQRSGAVALRDLGVDLEQLAREFEQQQAQADAEEQAKPLEREKVLPKHRPPLDEQAQERENKHILYSWGNPEYTDFGGTYFCMTKDHPNLFGTPPNDVEVFGYERVHDLVESTGEERDWVNPESAGFFEHYLNTVVDHPEFFVPPPIELTPPGVPMGGGVVTRPVYEVSSYAGRYSDDLARPLKYVDAWRNPPDVPKPGVSTR